MRARWLVLVLAGLLLLGLPSPAIPARGKKGAKQGVTVQIRHGMLVITGNRMANRVEVRLKRRRGRVLEVDVGRAGKAEFSLRRVFRRIVVRGGGGRDALGISERNGSFSKSERITLDGGRGVDRLLFSGTRRADSIDVSGSRRRVRVARGARTGARAAATVPLTGRRLEGLTVRPLGGADTVTLGALTRTGVRAASVELGSSGRGDLAPDTIFARATGGPDALSMSAIGTERMLGGLQWAVEASTVEAELDRFIALGRGGTDTLTLTGTDGPDNVSIAGGDGLMRAGVNGAAVYSDEVEAVGFNALGGADSLTVDHLGADPLGGTDVTQVALDLGSAPGAGGDGAADAVTINGGPGPENLAASSGPAGIAVAGPAAAVSVAAPEAGDHLTLNGGGGQDSVNTVGVSAGVIGLELRGGQDADTLTGGAGDEAFLLLPGDGADVAEGGPGTDRAEVGGSEGADAMSASAQTAGRALFLHDPDASLDTGDVETAVLQSGAGPDQVTVGDMTGSDVTDVEARLAGPGGAGDAGADSVTVNGTAGDDVVSITSPAGVVVAGLAAKTTVTGAEPAVDKLVVAAGGGGSGDVVDATTLAANRIGLVVQGGLGGDVILGSPGDDLVLGQDGDDTLLLGAGNDTALWNPGDDNDIVEGQAGTDTMSMTGNGASEAFELSANGGRVLLVRNVASVVLDANDVELVTVNALAGVDTVDVDDLAGTDVTRVDIGLAGAGGSADGQDDIVTQLGTNGADAVSVEGGPAGVATSGLAAGVSLTGADPGVDDLVVWTVGGVDLIDASAVKAGALMLTLNGGAGNDSLTGGDGNDFLIGGPDDDVMRGGPGTDNFDNSEGNDTIFQD